MNNLFLLGAGFTKAARSDSPLNAELLPALGAALPAGSVFLHYQKLYGTDDVEQLLTRLDLDLLSAKGQEDAKGTAKLGADRRRINAQIASFFRQFRFSEATAEASPWLRRFAEEVLQSGDAVISLNYDCFLEGMLDYFGVWSPRDGYARLEHPLADDLPKNLRGILIYKIHGSENFVESETYPNRNQTAIGFGIEPTIFPRSGAHTHFGGGILKPRPYVIAPSFVKIPHVDIAAMMLNLLDVARQARTLTIIGCGMRPEDSFLWLLLTRFLNRVEPRPRLVVVDPAASTIVRRVSDYWVGTLERIADVVPLEGGLGSEIERLSEVLRAP